MPVDKTLKSKRIWPTDNPNIIGGLGLFNFLVGMTAWSFVVGTDSSEKSLWYMHISIVLLSFGLPLMLYAGLLKRLKAFEAKLTRENASLPID